MQKILIEGSYGDCDYARFFKANGFDVVEDIYEADLICFTGGSDVNPALYSSDVHPTTHYDERRDTYCVGLYQEAKSLGLPCLGICRGSQFLCVMNDGSLYQDIDGHTQSHLAHTFDGKIIPVTSTHHQEMKPSGNYELLMSACAGNYRSYVNANGVPTTIHASTPTVESVYWPDSNDLSIQGHPEFCNASEDFKVWTIETIRNKLGD